ncbi:MAG: hypothetical protein J6R92_07410, partial [Akkermansia sp.]|nr:hypothetical protein [Akkermansia sp.]
MAQNAPFLTIGNEGNFQILQVKLKKLSIFAVNPEEALKWEFGGLEQLVVAAVQTQQFRPLSSGFRCLVRGNFICQGQISMQLIK